MGKGAEVACSVFFFRADAGEAGEGIGEFYPDVEETFVISEGDVVAGAVVFDEFSLEEEGFLFVANDVDLEIMDGVHEGAVFQVRTGFSGWGEVGGEAAFEIEGLADVDDGTEAVFHQVDSGLVGHVAEFCFQLLGNHWLGKEGIL